MTSLIALLIANLWFVSATERPFWKYLLGIFWLLVALLTLRP